MVELQELHTAIVKSYNYIAYIALLCAAYLSLIL